MPSKLKSVLRYALLHVDVILVLIYLAFRTNSLGALIAAFDAIAPSHGAEKLRFLVWGGTLFVMCAVCSYARRSHFAIPTNYAKGVLLFELMVLSAVVLTVSKSLSQEAAIDPYWLLELSPLSYLFEVVTTVGAGYILADFLSRIGSISKET